MTASPQIAGFLSALEKRYVIDRTLGEGGMGTVYLARDIRHSRPVAIKLLRPWAATWLGVHRFRREISITAGLQHPHILPLLDSGESGGALFYVTPFVSGGSLRTALDGGPLPVEEVVRLTAEMADALDYAHAQGVVHCDIKPENILLSNGHAVVADFGVARAVNQYGAWRRVDARVAGAGTAAYMSPEQGCGDHRLDGRSDVYSLACLVYEMLTGRPAFTGPNPQATIIKRFTHPLPWSDAAACPLPADIRAALTPAFANAPERRYRTAGELAGALGAPRQVRLSGSSRASGSGFASSFAAIAKRVVALSSLLLIR